MKVYQYIRDVLGKMLPSVTICPYAPWENLYWQIQPWWLGPSAESKHLMFDGCQPW